MPILIQCPICSAKFRAPDHAAGKTVPCGKCGGQIRVPGGEAAAKPHAPALDFSSVVASETSARKDLPFVIPEVRVETDEPAPSSVGLWLVIGGVVVLLALAGVTLLLVINSGVFGDNRHAKGDALPLGPGATKQTPVEPGAAAASPGAAIPASSSAVSAEVAADPSFKVVNGIAIKVPSNFSFYDKAQTLNNTGMWRKVGEEQTALMVRVIASDSAAARELDDAGLAAMVKALMGSDSSRFDVVHESISLRSNPFRRSIYFRAGTKVPQLAIYRGRLGGHFVAVFISYLREDAAEWKSLTDAAESLREASPAEVRAAAGAAPAAAERRKPAPIDPQLFQPAVALLGWSPSGADQLADEISIGRFRFRPPRGVAIHATDVSPKSLHFGAGDDKTQLPELWIQINAKQDKTQIRPWVVTQETFTDNINLLVIPARNGTTEWGRLDALTFARIEGHEDPGEAVGSLVVVGTGRLIGWYRPKDPSPPCTTVHYVASDGDDWIIITLHCSPGDAVLAKLEASARSIRVARADEPIIDPLRPEALATVIANFPSEGSAVAEIGGVAVEPWAILYLNHESEKVRIGAAEVLSAIGTEASIEPLRKLAVKPDKAAGAARVALRQIDAGAFDRVDESLAAVLGGAPEGQQRGLETLAQIPPDDRLAEVADALEAMAKQTPKPGYHLIYNLGLWGRPATIQVLQAIADKNAEPANLPTCYAAMARLGDKKAAAELIKLLEGEKLVEAKQALGRLGADGEPIAIKALSSKNDRACEGAIDVLSEIGGRASLSPLAVLTHRRDHFVSDSAKRALAAIREREKTGLPIKFSLWGDWEDWTLQPDARSKLGPDTRIGDYIINPPCGFIAGEEPNGTKIWSLTGKGDAQLSVQVIPRGALHRRYPRVIIRDNQTVAAGEPAIVMHGAREPKFGVIAGIPIISVDGRGPSARPGEWVAAYGAVDGDNIIIIRSAFTGDTTPAIDMLRISPRSLRRVPASARKPATAPAIDAAEAQGAPADR